MGIHLRFNEKWIDDASAQDVFEVVAHEARKKGVLVHASIYLPQEFGISDKADPRPSLRIVVTRMHTNICPKVQKLLGDYWWMRWKRNRWALTMMICWMWMRKSKRNNF